MPLAPKAVKSRYPTTMAATANLLRCGSSLLLPSCRRPGKPLVPIRATIHIASAAARARVCGGRQSFHLSRTKCTAADAAAVNAEADNSNATAAAPPPPSPADLKEAANNLDIRVGRILKAWRHEEADSLYVEEVDIGEPEPRTICSGLVKFVPLDHLQDRHVVVLANLKPRNMRGVKSSGMLMAASDPSHENVELLVPPEGSVPGERIWFGSEDDQENLPSPATPNQVQKKKLWELVQPHLKTDASCNALLQEHLMRTSAGVVVSPSLKNANIS